MYALRISHVVLLLKAALQSVKVWSKGSLRGFSSDFGSTAAASTLIACVDLKVRGTS